MQKRMKSGIGRGWGEPSALRHALHRRPKLTASNHADLIILGAPGAWERGMAWWRSVASSVTANAPCSVHVVRVTERADADPLEPPISLDDPPQ